MQKASANDRCTYNNGAFLEFDCRNDVVDPSKMTLVVQTKYTEAGRTWKSVVADFCSPSNATAIPLWNGRHDAVPGVFLWNAERRNVHALEAPDQPACQRGRGSVTAVKCSGCKDESVYFIGTQSVKTVSEFGQAPIDTALYRYMKVPASSDCTFKNKAFLLFDCSRRLQSRRT